MREVPQGRYTQEFREEALKLAAEEKLSLPPRPVALGVILALEDGYPGRC